MCCLKCWQTRISHWCQPWDQADPQVMSANRKLKSCEVSSPGHWVVPCVLGWCVHTPRKIHMGNFQNIYLEVSKIFVFPFQRADFQDVCSCEQVMKVLKQKMGHLFVVMDKVMKGWNIPGKLVRESFWVFCPFWVYLDFTCDTMKSTQNVEGIATNVKLIHPFIVLVLAWITHFWRFVLFKEIFPISLVCFNWFVQSVRSCSFDSLVESGRRSGDGGIQIHYVDEGAPGVSMKHDYD